MALGNTGFRRLSALVSFHASPETDREHVQELLAIKPDQKPRQETVSVPPRRKHEPLDQTLCLNL